MVLLSYYKNFATMFPARSLAMSSATSPAKTIFATIANFCCCEISDEFSDEVSSEVSLFFFYFVDEPFFATWNKSGVIICYR